MQKKIFMPIILVSLVFFSCWDFSLPNKIELEVEGSVDLPVRITASDWGSVLTKTLKKAFSGTMDDVIGVEVYNVNNGQDVQAFLVYFPIKISDSLNPKDYLDKINLSQTDDSALKINESVEVPSITDFTLVTLPNISISSSQASVSIPIGSLSGGPIETPMDVNTDFLHAIINEGSFNINLDIYDENGHLLKNQFTFKYDITIEQDSYTKDSTVESYDGLHYTTDASDLASNKRELQDQNINGSKIKISGEITVTNTNPGAGASLRGELRISLSLSKYKELDWDFRGISNGLKIDPVSLASVAENIKSITFNKYDDNTGSEPTEGIGINVKFSELSDKLNLKMSVSCTDLDFDGTERNIHQGNNIFGNKDKLPLDLTKYKNDLNKLIFGITLTPVNSNTNVLHLTDLTAGETLNINGEAKLFQHWVEAEVNIGDDFEEQFPDKGEEPINLSLLDDYFKGFKFNNIEAAAYFSGPEKIIKTLTPNLKIEVKSSAINTTVMEETQITFDKNHIVIKGNSNYLDAKGAYKDIGLPLSQGRKPINFLSVLNSLPRPNDLFFHYNMKVSSADTITIKPEMFDDNNEAASNDISVTIMLLIRLDLTAGDNGGQMTFPDIFKDKKDLLGRNNLEENSKFTSLNVDYINYTVDFTSGFFTGAKLFIEKENADKSKLLFPDGILLDGSKIALNIMNKEFEFIKHHLIDPDLRLEFERGRTITVPRSIGVISVKVEAKGKHTINLSF